MSKSQSRDDWFDDLAAVIVLVSVGLWLVLGFVAQKLVDRWKA